MKTLASIIKDLPSFQIEYRLHATRRMFQRGITGEDVEGVLKDGEIVEVYEDDYPLPSYLLKGQTSARNPLHAVEKVMVIITAYVPDPILWTNDFTRRKL